MASGRNHTQTHTHTHTDVRTETILGNQAHTWFKNGSKPANLASYQLYFSILEGNGSVSVVKGSVGFPQVLKSY